MNLDKPLKGKRLLICEEALLDYNGHYYSWIKAIRHIHEEKGCEVIVAANQKLVDSIQEEFGALSVYSRNNWSGIYNQPQAWRRYLGVLQHNWLVWKETARLLKSVGPVDCVLLPASRIHHLIAWRVLSWFGLSKKFKRLIPFILTSEAVYNKDFSQFHFKRSSLLMKLVLRSFKKEVEAGRVIFAGDSHITCSEYENLSGLPFRVFPSPAAGLQTSDAEGGGEIKPVEAPKDPVFLMSGVSVYDKGVDLLQDAILQILRNNSDFKARFIIQWGAETISYEGEKIPIKDELRNAPQLTIIERTVSNEEYAELFDQADFLVLPYRRKVYFNRISGVAVEAACSGLPMIVTERTWLSWALDEYGAGVTVKDNDAADLAKQIEYCLNHSTELKQLAEDRKVVALQKNSTEEYLKCVWE